MSDVQHGTDVLIYIGGVTVAGQRNCSIARNAETIDTSCKNDFPNRTKKVSWRDSNVSLDGAYIDADTGYDALMAAYNAGSTVTVTELKALAVIYTATAIVTGITKNAEQGGETTFTINLDITGAWA